MMDIQVVSEAIGSSVAVAPFISPDPNRQSRDIGRSEKNNYPSA